MDQNKIINVHDFIIKNYFVKFEKNQIIFNIYNESVKKRIVFHNSFAYKFYNEMPYSIILDLQEWPLDAFFVDNKKLLLERENKGWPMMYDKFEDLENKIYEANVTYQFLSSSYGLYGWILAEKVKILDE